MTQRASCLSESRFSSFIISDMPLRATLSVSILYLDTIICAYSSAVIR